MKVAVCTLTRDRLEYTQHCFDRLHDLAGCWFDHYVLDQGSTDGTREWLSRTDHFDFERVILEPTNVGINVGMNRLVDEALDTDDYDVIVKVDNDCELVVNYTVRDVALLAREGNAILSPRVEGLESPPGPQGRFEILDETILDIPQIGGVFMAIPTIAFDTFRYNDAKLLFDDVDLCWHWRKHGGRCGYVERLHVNHYETTAGQRARYPQYFERKDAEYRKARRC